MKKISKKVALTALFLGLLVLLWTLTIILWIKEPRLYNVIQPLVIGDLAYTVACFPIMLKIYGPKY